MPKLIKNGQWSEDSWQLFEGEAAEVADLAKSIVSLPAMLSLFDAGQAPRAVWLSSDDEVQALKPYLARLELVACRFNAFADGRSFSQARILRDNLDFKGEIRAVGYFLQDQMFYLSRCGFNSFAVADDSDLDSIKVSLEDFSEVYQAACDISEPLFRRRH